MTRQKQSKEFAAVETLPVAKVASIFSNSVLREEEGDSKLSFVSSILLGDELWVHDLPNQAAVLHEDCYKKSNLATVWATFDLIKTLRLWPEAGKLK